MSCSIDRGLTSDLAPGDTLAVYDGSSEAFPPPLIGWLELDDTRSKSSSGTFLPVLFREGRRNRGGLLSIGDVAARRLVLDESVIFLSGTATMLPTAPAELIEVRRYVDNYHPNKLLIEVYPGVADGDTTGKEVSVERAEHVRLFLSSTMFEESQDMLVVRSTSQGPSHRQAALVAGRHRIEIVPWE